VSVTVVVAVVAGATVSVTGFDVLAAFLVSPA
jgi:hypothetical protein